jgi:hypothetical protein
VHAALRAEGERHGRKRIARLMRGAGPGVQHGRDRTGLTRRRGDEAVAVQRVGQRGPRREVAPDELPQPHARDVARHRPCVDRLAELPKTEAIPVREMHRLGQGHEIWFRNRLTDSFRSSASPTGPPRTVTRHIGVSSGRSRSTTAGWPPRCPSSAGLREPATSARRRVARSCNSFGWRTAWHSPAAGSRSLQKLPHALRRASRSLDARSPSVGPLRPQSKPSAAGSIRLLLTTGATISRPMGEARLHGMPRPLGRHGRAGPCDAGWMEPPVPPPHGGVVSAT